VPGRLTRRRVAGRTPSGPTCAASIRTACSRVPRYLELFDTGESDPGAVPNRRAAPGRGRRIGGRATARKPGPDRDETGPVDRGGPRAARDCGNRLGPRCAGTVHTPAPSATYHQPWPPSGRDGPRSAVGRRDPEHGPTAGGPGAPAVATSPLSVRGPRPAATRIVPARHGHRGDGPRPDRAAQRRAGADCCRPAWAVHPRTGEPTTDPARAAVPGAGWAGAKGSGMSPGVRDAGQRPGGEPDRARPTTSPVAKAGRRQPPERVSSLAIRRPSAFVPARGVHAASTHRRGPSTANQRRCPLARARARCSCLGEARAAGSERDRRRRHPARGERCGRAGWPRAAAPPRRKPWARHRWRVSRPGGFTRAPCAGPPQRLPHKGYRASFRGTVQGFLTRRMPSLRLQVRRSLIAGRNWHNATQILSGEG